MPSDTISPRPLRLSQKIRGLGLLSKYGDREKSQSPAPFRGVHTPDRPERLVTPIEAPSEQECSDRIASWHRAVLDDDRFDNDKESWHDWTSDTESDYGDEEKEKEVDVEKPKDNKPLDAPVVLNPVLDDRFSYGGVSMCSPQLGEAEATQLQYRHDFRKVSHHPLLAKARYEPEQLRQTYVAEESVKGKPRSESPAPIPARSAARAPLAPRSTDGNNSKRHTPPDQRPKRESPPRTAPVQSNNITPEPARPKRNQLLFPLKSPESNSPHPARPQDFRPSVCPHCKNYSLAPNPRTRPPLTCPNCRKGLTTFPGTPIPPPLLKNRRFLRIIPVPQARPSAKQRLDDSLRRLRTPTPPLSPAPTIWPAPSNLHPRKQKPTTAGFPPLSAPPPASPLPGIPPRSLKQAPSDSSSSFRRQQPHVMDAMAGAYNSGTSSSSSSSSRGGGGGAGGGMMQLPIARSKFYQESGSRGQAKVTSRPRRGDAAGDSADLLSDIIGSYSGDDEPKEAREEQMVRWI
ncbi:hypothetical protein QBC44DRAFT_366445 [Cladorrhinum sp. PSN332]|nr:hypothetical protein QBC44DRAFT_366445 [Cladorrhinum sp. PSN332]